MTQNINLPDPDTLASFLQTAEALGGETAYQAARDAGQTELTYRQWVQVRTPEFKAWCQFHSKIEPQLCSKSEPLYELTPKTWTV